MKNIKPFMKELIVTDGETVAGLRVVTMVQQALW
jgi:hypothetical protein